MFDAIIYSTVPLYFLLPATATAGFFAMRMTVREGRAARAEQAELDARPLPDLSA